MCDRLVVFLILVLLGNACSSPQSTTVVGADNASTVTASATSTTSLSPSDEFSASIDEFSALLDDPEWSVVKSNLNDPSTPIGELCWLIWEVNRQEILWLHAQGVKKLESLAKDPNQTFKDAEYLEVEPEVYQAMNKVVPFAKLTTDKLPSELVPLATTFFEALNDQIEGDRSNYPFKVVGDILESSRGEEIYKILVSQPDCDLPFPDA